MNEDNRNHPIHRINQNELKAEALKAIKGVSVEITKWVRSIRPGDGRPGRFLWAVESLRDANLISTTYVLEGLKRFNLFHDIISKADLTEGAAWYRSMCVGNEQYRDSSICSREPPDWPVEQPWPTTAIMEVMNRYALSGLEYLGDAAVKPEEPPPGWLQVEEADKAPEWIKNRPWETSAWSAGAHARHTMCFLLNWYNSGLIGLDPLVESIRAVYDMQDPDTGLWGGKKVPLFDRINGTFKLTTLLQNVLELPLPHAERIIDQVFTEFYREDYETNHGGCDEFDNWYVMHFALKDTEGYRRREAEAMAAYRIAATIRTHRKPDGGLSFFPDRCNGNWNGVDMAPAVGQGDAMGLALISSSINVCAEILGMCEEMGISGLADMIEGQKKDVELNLEIRKRVFEKEV